jgi:hypothetical protein
LNKRCNSRKNSINAGAIFFYCTISPGNGIKNNYKMGVTFLKADITFTLKFKIMLINACLKQQTLLKNIRWMRNPVIVKFVLVLSNFVYSDEYH